jgi:hypothetical protein
VRGPSVTGPDSHQDTSAVPPVPWTRDRRYRLWINQCVAPG